MTYTPAPTDPRWTSTNVQELRALAVNAAQDHTNAMRAGGYESGHGDTVEATDYVEVTQETVSILFRGAADLIETHVRTGIELEHAPGWAALVNRALDIAGIR